MNGEELEAIHFLKAQGWHVVKYEEWGTWPNFVEGEGIRGELKLVAIKEEA